LLAGLYQWELTPPHVDLLGRMSQLCGAAGAPFVSAIGPDALREKEYEWHPLIRQAWAGLREAPASAYLGLATPRFLLRMPYGKRNRADRCVRVRGIYPALATIGSCRTRTGPCPRRTACRASSTGKRS